MVQRGRQRPHPSYDGDAGGGTGLAAPAGPAYLNVPLEILLEEWDGREAKPIVRPGSTHSSPEEVDPVAQLIREAENPVIVTETAGREAGGFEALVAFAEAWNIPVVEPDSAVCGNFPRAHSSTPAATSARGWTRRT